MTKERFFEIAEEEGFGFDAQGFWDSRPGDLKDSETPEIDENNIRLAFRIVGATAPSLVRIAKNYHEKKKAAKEEANGKAVSNDSDSRGPETGHGEGRKEANAG